MNCNVIIIHLHIDKLLFFILQLLIIDSMLRLGRSVQSHSLVHRCISVFEVPDAWGISPPLYSEAVVTPACSIPTDENKPLQQTNISAVSDTTTQMEDRKKQQVEVILSGSTQLDSANNSRFTVHEMRQTQHSDTELHM
jgi:hypothetical protein